MAEQRERGGGSIKSDELLTLQELRRRLGWQNTVFAKRIALACA